MITTKRAHIGVFASVLLVGLATVVLAKKPPKDPPPEPPPPPILYQIEWLAVDHLWPWTRASDVNVDGTIVGNSHGWDGNERAFVYAVGEGMRDLNSLVDQTTRVVLPDVPDEELFGPLPESITLTSADCINDAGRIVGEFVDEEGVGGIYVYDSTFDVLYMQPLSDVWRVADLSEDEGLPGAHWGGTVVGTRVGVDADVRGFAWKPGQDVVFLPSTPLEVRSATGINSYGEIVGQIALYNSGPIFRHTLGDTHLEILSDETRSGYRLTGVFSGARIDVNDNGVVVGNVLGKHFFHPARYTDNDGWQELTLEFSGTSVEINNANQICGVISEKSYKVPDTGFVYHTDIGFWSLNDLLVGSEEEVAAWFSGNAQDNNVPQGISNPDETGYGTIVGYKLFASSGAGVSMGFVLRPLPAPTE